MNIDIRRAVDGDLPLILQWREEGESWLRDRGTDQWSALGRDTFRQRVRDSIARGETWIAEHAGRPVGTIAVDGITNPDLWSREELRGALVLHRMIVPRSHAGMGIGRQLLSHAEQIARHEGCTWIVLDAWTTNTDLHRYYLDNGFEHVRTVLKANSGALFRRRVRVERPHGRGGSLASRPG